MKNQSRIISYLQAPFFEIRYTQQSDRSYEMHAHPTLSIGFMCESSTLFSTPNGAFTLIPGSLAVIEPYIQHTCNPIHHTKRSYAMVYFDTAYCTKLQAELFGETTTFLPLSSTLIFHQSLFERFQTLILSLIHDFDDLKVTHLRKWLKEFLWLYTRHETPFKTHSTIEQIAFYLQNRLDESLSLNELSTRFGINPFVLIRQFKKRFGCTPMHYWHDARIHHARKLLQNQVPLALCAQYCGFVDQSHFHRFFKRKTALTPKEYQVNFVQ